MVTALYLKLELVFGGSAKSQAGPVDGVRKAHSADSQ